MATTKEIEEWDKKNPLSKFKNAAERDCAREYGFVDITHEEHTRGKLIIKKIRKFPRSSGRKSRLLSEYEVPVKEATP